MKLTRPDSMPQIVDMLVEMGMTFDLTLFGDGLSVASPGHVGANPAYGRAMRAAPDAATARMYQHAIKSARKRWPRVVAEIHRRHNEASMRDFADKRRLKCEIGTLVDFLVSKGMTFRIVGTDTLQVADPERGTTDLIYHEAMRVAVNNWDALGVELRRRLAVKS